VIALILPAADTPFARAAEAVRAGFFAAHAAAGSKATIQVVEVEETPEKVIDAVRAARDRGVRLVVGPLTRVATNSLVDHREPIPPTLTLNVPEKLTAVPESLLALGLPVEDEATWLVTEALRELPAGASASAARRHVVVVGNSALARRGAAAIVNVLQATNERFVALELAQHGAASVVREITKTQTTSIFLALDVHEAVQVRTRLPLDAPLFATSLLSGAGKAAASDLEGVRFADMPWLIEPDRPVARTYPRPPATYNAELQRLYALGIDAYRVAGEWMAGRTRFEVDGVTGWLRVDRALGAKVERTPMMAVFREGRVLRTDVMRDVLR